MEIAFLKNEAWFGGAVYHGVCQPYTVDSSCEIHLKNNHTPNQCMPLLLSDKGRFLWNRQGFTARFESGAILYDGGTELGQAEENTLRGAYQEAMARFFPFYGAPDERFFTAPVYNTWIELTFHQTQEGALQYAQDILKNGLPAGVLMMDDGWSPYYGRWVFDKERFPDAGELLHRLHEMGFTVMVWICPFITPDTLEYRELAQKGLLVCNAAGEVHIAQWWNGWSAILDLQKEGACAWLRGKLEPLQSLGVDGFKFDAGDSIYYPANGDAQCGAWARFGAAYPLNEYRASWCAGGLPLMQRLCDKHPTWDERGLAALVPDAITASLTGHPYVCPDMIGGGEYLSFLQQEQVDNELFVRWAEAACLMPVMQFSAAPWRVLDARAFAGIKAAIALRESYRDYLLETLYRCRITGEPMLKPLCWMFSEEDCSGVTDEFLLGDSLLVSPLLTREVQRRTVYLPKGRWKCGEEIMESPGGRLTVRREQCICGGLFTAERL